MMRSWVERAALETEGLVAPEGGTQLDRHAAASIELHLEAFRASKLAEGRTERHVAETVTMIRDSAAACGWTALGDLYPDELERFIGRKRAPVPQPGERIARAWTPRTAHKYVTALRTFARWCVADGRLAADPLARVKKPSPTRQRARRMLLVEEWRCLKASTQRGPMRMGLDGHSRRLLYEVAIFTGLRSGELRSLTRSCLMLEGDRPFVLLDGKHTKNGKAARQHIRRELAAELHRYVAQAMPGAPVFDMPRRERVATMLRADLDAAREEWVREAGNDPSELARREGSAFLKAVDHDGRILDFHSLRHTCGSWAAVGAASPKAIQTLMRHSSIVLTLDTYGHLLPDEASETVDRMPGTEPVSMRLTGTDGAPAVDTATAVHFGAPQGTMVQRHKNKNGPGVLPEPIFKRGGRDSNPQHPDRQSGTLTN
jgi:integrase